VWIVKNNNIFDIFQIRRYFTFVIRNYIFIELIKFLSKVYMVRIYLFIIYLGVGSYDK